MKIRYLKNIVKIALTLDRCTGCGRCTEVCPHEVLDITDRKVSVIDQNACMECGACTRNCPTGAIYVKSGVGCTTAILNGWINGTEPDCDCSGSSGGSCC